MTPQQAAKLAAEASERVSEFVARAKRGKEAFPSLVLRALKQARYHPQNLGHSGLASTAYCHFTSPIRRYPDLVVHRALLREIGATDEPLPEDIAASAEHCSVKEREAGDVEYRADDIVAAWLLEDVLFERGWEEPFSGEITGMIGSGLFIRFGDVFEGYLPARRLPGDYYEIDAHRDAARRAAWRSDLPARRPDRGARPGDPQERGQGRTRAGRVGIRCNCAR